MSGTSIYNSCDNILAGSYPSPVSAAIFGRKYPWPCQMTLNPEVTGTMPNVSGIIEYLQNESRIIKIDQGVSDIWPFWLSRVTSVRLGGHLGFWKMLKGKLNLPDRLCLWDISDIKISWEKNYINQVRVQPKNDLWLPDYIVKQHIKITYTYPGRSIYAPNNHIFICVYCWFIYFNKHRVYEFWVISKFKSFRN